MPPLAWALLPLELAGSAVKGILPGGGVGAREGKRANGKRGNNAIFKRFHETDS